MDSFWKKIRKDFSLHPAALYLDHAAGGPVPIPVKDKIETYHRENAGEADFAWPKWVKRAEYYRSLAARFIHAEPEEIAFIHSTSQGMNAAADMLAHEGSVLTNTSEFPSSTLPWIWRKSRMIYQEPEPAGVLSLEKMKALLSPRVKTILTSYIQYATGFRQDLKAVGKIKGNRYLVVNATQALGAFPLDVKAWKADVLCANSYKWLMAGYGGGLLYVRKELLKKFPPASIGWRSVQNADGMNNRRAKVLSTAARYELGCASFGTIFSVGAAMEYLSSIGMEKISARILELTAYAAARLQSRGFEIASSLLDHQRSGILIIKIQEAQNVWKRLLGHKIFVSPRGEGLRLGPHFYNTPEEIDLFVRKLSEIRDEGSGRMKRKGGSR